jgi:dTDP-D-glucose 4,6-dehydratase
MENKILVTGGNGLVGSEFIGDYYFKPLQNYTIYVKLKTLTD